MNDNKEHDSLEEIEDEKLAISAWKEIQEGKSPIFPWKEVKKELGLN